ncbi:SDR family NAD(P)-dependent oxidoreductase [Streptomyces sp. NPDC003006]
MPKYTGRKAVVIGGATGLGRAIAKRLVEGGAEVLLTGGPTADLAEAAAEVGPGAHIIRCDPMDSTDSTDSTDTTQAAAQTKTLAPAIAAQLGGIDLLFVHGEADLPAPPPPALLRLLRDGGSVVLTGATADPAVNSLAPLLRCHASINETARTALHLATETQHAPTQHAPTPRAHTERP